MGLVTATEAWVLAILYWCVTAVQEAFAWSLLCCVVGYGGLLVTTAHLAVTSFVPDDREPRRAYFAATLAFSLFAAGCVADTANLYSAGTFRPPREGVAPCCANYDVGKMYQILFFTDSLLYVLSAGVLMGAVLVQLLVAGAGMYDHDTRTAWPGIGWANSLAALLAARLAVIFDGSAVALCPQDSFYLQLFTQPLVSLSVVLLLFMLIFVVWIVLDGLKLSVLAWRALRILNLVFHVAFASTCFGVLAERGLLTLQFILALLLCVAVAVQGCVWSWIRPVPRAPPPVVTPPLPGQGPRAPLPSIDPPTAPPRAMLPTAAQARTQARYYVPTHVVTGIDKKAI
jgi:hypothetical protein